MRNKIILLSISILIIFIISLAYLSVYGIKTDSFNSFINNKAKEYNSKLTLRVDEVFIKLNQGMKNGFAKNYRINN